MRSSLNASAVDYQCLAGPHMAHCPHRAPSTRCTADPVHRVWHRFLASQGVTAGAVEVPLTTPAALLSDFLPGVTTVDYVNIDVEQQESLFHTSFSSVPHLFLLCSHLSPLCSTPL